MIIIGDSHTRAYGLNRNFTPIFLGPGKDNNFIDWANVDVMLKKCYQIAETIHPKTVILCLGEPETRYAMGLGWNPWLSQYIPDTDNFSFLDKCIALFKFFTEELTKKLGWDVYVQNVVLTQSPEQCRYIDYYNHLLSQIFADRLIFFNDRIRRPEGTIDEEYSWDRIHANNKICEFVEEYMNIDKQQREAILELVMKKHLKKNTQFNCLVFEGESKKSLIKRILQRLV